MNDFLRRHAALFAGYLVVAVVATWPLARHLDSAFTGAPSGDTGVYVWNTWVFQHEIANGRLPFYTSSIFSVAADAPPANLSLHNYATFANLLAWPLVPLVGLVAAFNLVFLFNIALAGYGAHLLARDFEHREPESWLSGLAFTLSPVLIARGVGHFSLVAAAPLPIFAILLRRLSATGDTRYAYGLGAVIAWATCADAYYGIFCLVMAGITMLMQFASVERAVDAPVARIVGLRRTLNVLLLIMAGFVVILAMGGGVSLDFFGRRLRATTLYTPMLVLTILGLARLALTRRPRLSLPGGDAPRQARRIVVAAGAVLILLLAPVLYAVGDQMLHGNADFSQPLWRSSPPGVDLLSLVMPNPNHALWGAPMRALLEQWTGRGDAFPEAVGSLSLVALLTMVVAWWKGGWQPSRIRVGAAVCYVLFALGPFLQVAGVNTQMPLPWAVLRYVPVLGLVRSPGRFIVLATLVVAVLFAQALTQLGRRFPERRRLILATVAVLLAIELVPGSRTLYSAEIPALYRTIAADPRADIRVLELPFGVRDGTSSLGDFTARTQYFQTAHGKAILGGYLSRVSPLRRRQAREMPVLNAFITLSERRTLTEAQVFAAADKADEFLRRSRLGYVVIDETRASPALSTFAVGLLGLTLVEREGPMALYVPRAPSPPAR
jgi:hypothetical protein